MKKAHPIALNKAVGEWENQSLASLLLDLQETGYNLGLTGFDDEEIDALLARKDVSDIDDGGGEYTTAVWVDCNFDYWID